MNQVNENSSHSGSLKVEDLYFSFSEHSSSIVDILKGVTLEAQRGEITSIAGPSGCGKSTLLYLMGLLERPGSGKILMDNMEVQNLSDRKRTIARNQLIGFVFQFHFLIKELTVLENVRLPLLKNGTDRTIANQISSELLDDLGLKNKAHRPAYKLSGGEQQRVAIARSLVNSPKYLLADEPTGNLDAQNSQAVFELLLLMAQKLNIAVVLVTHNENLAQQSDQEFRMLDGKIFT